MRERERCAAAQVAGTAALDLQLGSRVGRERAAGGGLLGEQPMRSWIALDRVEGLTGWGSCGISLDDVMIIFFLSHFAQLVRHPLH